MISHSDQRLHDHHRIQSAEISLETFDANAAEFHVKEDDMW